MFHLILLCREKGKTVIRKRPSPAERLPSLGRSSRALQPQTFIAKEAGCSQSAVSKHVNRKLIVRKSVEEKDAQPTERTATL